MTCVVTASNAGGAGTAASSNSRPSRAAGGAALLIDEPDGFAVDFGYATLDAQRVAVKMAGVVTSFGLSFSPMPARVQSGSTTRPARWCRWRQDCRRSTTIR